MILSDVPFLGFDEFVDDGWLDDDEDSGWYPDALACFGGGADDFYE